MHPDTQTFVTSLFERSQMLGQAAFITLTAIHPDGAHPTPSRHIPTHHPGLLAHALERLAEANRAGWGAYVAIATRKANLGRWRRGRREDLLALPALFIDIDCPDADTLHKLTRFALPPSCLVSSGRGLHCYWHLAEPTRSLTTAEHALRGLALHFGADLHMSSTQSLRIPGSCNTKPGRNVPCRLLDHQPDLRYSLDDFRPYMLPAAWSRQTALPALHEYRTLINREQMKTATDAVVDRLIRDYGGFWRRNGWLASTCPWPHAHDLPGKHFAYQPDHRVGFCFGTHGKRLLDEVCQQIGIALPGLPV